MKNLVNLIELPLYEDNHNALVVAEGSTANVPFIISRVFNVQASIGSIRGKHAHLKCTQLLICTIGSVEVICDDGFSLKKYILDKSNFGLLIKPGVWAQQKYLEEHTVLTVLCDRPYEEDDYVCDYEEFKYIKVNSKLGSN
jgi:dTDP-4-dehydrorhamnose 3,5-epimerase-like enzyme